MSYYVIGLGSMGKRRVRCLIALGIKPEDIWGYDTREDRCEEAREKYSINIASGIEEVDFDKVNAVIVSLPPDKHNIGIDIAVKYNKPVFVEASVMLDETLEIEKNSKSIFVAPSCTFMFHPMIKEIKKLISSTSLGKVCNFSYHSGQYLPDWHPWEDVNDFYVSKKETGGAREIVPYELTWITDLFGFPKQIKGYYRKTGSVGCDIDDSYVCCLDYNDMIGTLVVDVISRYPARNLIINCQDGQIQWRWDNNRIEVYDAKQQKTFYINQDTQSHEEGYSDMIGEEMYIEEIDSFLKGIDEASQYPNTLDKDIKVLKLLDNIEKSDDNK